MKKIILALSAIALVVSCSQSRKWTDKERDEVRKVVRDRHDRSAIRHMEAKNYTNLEECVVTTIEETYPDYNRFDKLTGKTDTVDAVIVDCLGFTIGPNYENLPLLFPYDQLQQAGILPGRFVERSGQIVLRLSDRQDQGVVPYARSVHHRVVRRARSSDRGGRCDATVRVDGRIAGRSGQGRCQSQNRCQ